MPLPTHLGLLDQPPRATEPVGTVWSLAQAIAASPLIVLASPATPRVEQQPVPIARGITLPDPHHAWLRVRQRFTVLACLRGDLSGDVTVDQALWRLHLDAHRSRVLQGRVVQVSVPRVQDGLLDSPPLGEPVLVLLRRTRHGTEFAADGAVLHAELEPVVRALLASAAP